MVALGYFKFNIVSFLLFRVMEIHRICEVTATPVLEGANLSELIEQEGDLIILRSIRCEAVFFISV